MYLVVYLHQVLLQGDCYYRPLALREYLPELRGALPVDQVPFLELPDLRLLVDRESLEYLLPVRLSQQDHLAALQLLHLLLRQVAGFHLSVLLLQHLRVVHMVYKASSVRR
jgi:hypothetical protein